ncbi:MAG: Nif3-like dinuclear metal center hexameric protein [Bacteroidales bacterium]|nr:Nif3-like dinuclear metal center hexameric protein [Bacteroidales bacterium]
MKIKELIKSIEQLYPLAFQESYDNSGSQISFPENEINGILICLDITEQVIDEAIAKQCNLIISHHPLLFKTLKKINPETHQGRIVIKAIQNQVSIYAIHTNFDSSMQGTNRILADLLQLQNIEILEPVQHQLKKLVTYVPHDYAEIVRKALFDAGAGQIGNYDSCSYNVEGYGTFKANEGCNPYVGAINEEHHEPETRIETIFPAYLQNKIVSALLDTHPYEEVAYDIYMLENTYSQVGIGIIGYLLDPMSVLAFQQYVKQKIGCKVIRYNKSEKNIIQKVALCSGSGASYIQAAIKNNADAFITADLKYHDFTDCPSSLLLIDAGHFETEIHFVQKIFEIITKKNTNFAVRLSENCSNPVNYF